MSNGGGQFKSFGPFFSSAGVIYRGIKINVYAAGTTTNKTYWTDENKATPGAFPLEDVDQDGVVVAFFDGDYRFQVKDSAGVDLDDIIDWDNVKVTSDMATMWEANHGTAYPAVTSANKWQAFAKHTAGDVLEDVGISDGVSFKSISGFGNKVVSGSNYADLNAAILSIGAVQTTLVITSSLAAITTDTVPSTLELRFEGQGIIPVSSGQTLTINGAIQAPSRQIVTGPGTILITGNSINPVWFSTAGTGLIGARWTGWEAIMNAQAANTAFIFPPGFFAMDTAITSKDGWDILGSGENATDIESTVTASSFNVYAIYNRLSDFKLSKSGTAGTSIGVDWGGTPTTTGHNGTMSRLFVTLFHTGVQVQRTFYSQFKDVDATDNTNYGFRVMNTTNSNTFVNLACRGSSAGIQDIGISIADTTTNSSDNKIFGGTFEGNEICQICIIGTSNNIVVGPHVEPHAQVAITGSSITMTNGSTAVTGSGTSFSTQLKVGQAIKLSADSVAHWMKIKTITDDTNIVLSDQYQGTGGTGAGLWVALGIHIINGGASAVRNSINWPNITGPSGSNLGLYIESGTDNRYKGNDPQAAVIVGSGATGSLLESIGFAGGLTDLGSNTQVFGSALNVQHYIKDGTTKVFSVQKIGGVMELNGPSLTSIPAISATSTAAKNLRGNVAFSTSGTAAVTFATAETNTSYEIFLGAQLGETFWVTSKTTSGFTMNSSNASSTATVSWLLIR